MKTYLPQLDGLRACAVLMVMAFHFCPEIPFWKTYGSLGVRLFFVLSGFLITGILLNARAASRDIKTEYWPTTIRFYCRRALRLLPVFYLVIALALVFDVDRIRQTWPWHVFYASNIRFSLTADWEGPVSHFWSLAVEEQFYLVWPAVVLLCPQRALMPSLIAIILLSVASRIACILLGLNNLVLWTMPFSSMDALGAGALLALLARNSQLTMNVSPARFPRWATVALALSVLYFGISIISFVLIPSTNTFLQTRLPTATGELMWAVLFAGLIWRASRGLRDLFGRVLGSWPLRKLGQISYGVYLIHNFVPYTFYKLRSSYDLLLILDTSMVRFLVFAVITIGLATLSWHFVEAPINRFRKQYAYAAPLPAS